MIQRAFEVLNCHDDWDFYRFFFQLSDTLLQVMGLLGHAVMDGQQHYL